MNPLRIGCLVRTIWFDQKKIKYIGIVVGDVESLARNCWQILWLNHSKSIIGNFLSDTIFEYIEVIS